MRDEEIPVRRLDMPNPRKAKRDAQFIPPISWTEAAPVFALCGSPRSVALWFAIHTQSKICGERWVRVPGHRLESVGLADRSGPSRAVAELERHGFVEVRRRPGYAPLLRLVSAAERGSGP